MIIEKINNVLLELSGGTGASVDNEGTHDILGMPPAVYYVLGSLMIVIGIASFFLYPKSKRKADEYRKEQLVEFNKSHPGARAATDYSKTGMYLPAWEKAKLFAPVFFGLVFCLIGISWMVGHTLFSW